MDNQAIINEIWNESYNIDENTNKAIPGKQKIKRSDGYYCKGTCFFIDLKNSSNFTKMVTNKRNTLRRIFASFHKLMIKNIWDYCREYSIRIPSIEIAGDGLYCVFNVQGSRMNVLWGLTEKLFDALNDLNAELSDRQLCCVEMGIGIHTDDILVFKLDGHRQHVWVGDVVNYASKFASFASEEIGNVVVSKEINQLLTRVNFTKYFNEKLEVYCYSYKYN